MALIKCIECGHMMSDKADKCPQCGCPMTSQNETTRVNQGEYARNPGYPRLAEQEYERDSDKLVKWLIAILAIIIFLALLGAGGYWLWHENNKKEAVQTESSVETTVSEKEESGNTLTKPNSNALEKNAPQQIREGGAGPSIEADNPARSNGVTLSGSIGQYNVHMDLDIDGSNVTGSYYYRSSGSGARLYLRGTLYSDGEMVLNETNANGDRTGHFDGTYRRGRSYEGLFENYRGDVLSFTLIE